MPKFDIVIDTNVIVAALRSRNGASHKLLRIIDSGKFTIHVSVALILEYESVLKRQEHLPTISHSDIDSFIDYICAIAKHHQIYFSWRPSLKDQADEHVLELAISSGSNFIIT